MSSKLLSLFVFGVLALVFLAGLASAATIANWNFDSSTLAPSTGAGTLTLSDSRTATSPFPSGNAPSLIAAMSSTGWDVANRYIEISLSTVGYENLILRFDEQVSATGPSAFQVQYSSDGSIFTNLGSQTSTAPTFTVNPMHTFDFSTITIIDNNANAKLRITVPAGSTASSAAGTFRIDNILIEGTALPTTPSEITACNTTGNLGNIEVRKIDFTNNGMFSSNNISYMFGKDDEWFPLDNVEVQIDVKNKGSVDVNNIEVDWGIYNTRTNEWIIEPIDEKDFDLRDGKTKTLTVSFNLEKDLDVDLSDLNDGSNYNFYVLAKGEVDDTASTPTCASDFKQASVVVESDFVVLNNIQAPATVQCGANVEVLADVWNVGDNDQNDVSVKLADNNAMGGIIKSSPVGDIDAFDKKRVAISFTVPKNIAEKTYDVTLYVLDEDNEVYQNNYNDDYSEFIIPLKVQGGCTGSTAPVTITANLVSGGKAGQDLVVKATVTNTGTASATYTLNSAGHGQWASSYVVQPSTLTLAAGQSGEATYTFKVNRDASGEQTFNIEMVSGNQVTTQPVSVMIEKAGFFSSITGGAIGDNGLLWGLGILNVVLIIVIILVAMRVMRK